MKILPALVHHYHGYDLLEALGNRNDITFIFNGINADKFLSAPSANGVGFPDMAAHGLGKGFQDFIACLMAVGFVKVMKMVDVRKKQGKRLLQTVVLRKACLQHRFQKEPVRQLGEGVMIGHGIKIFHNPGFPVHQLNGSKHFRHQL